MPTASERQALAFLAGVALLGGGARVWVQHRDSERALLQNGTSISAESVQGQLSAIDSAKSSKRGRKHPASHPRAPTTRVPSTRLGTAVAERPEVVDVDVATAEEIERLPRIGPALAARIVANRDSFGAFGSLAALGEVRGIGDAMLKVLDPVVMFSARPRAPRSNAATATSKR